MVLVVNWLHFPVVSPSLSHMQALWNEAQSPPKARWAPSYCHILTGVTNCQLHYFWRSFIPICSALFLFCFRKRPGGGCFGLIWTDGQEVGKGALCARLSWWPRESSKHYPFKYCRDISFAQIIKVRNPPYQIVLVFVIERVQYFSAFNIHLFLTVF